MTGINNGTKIIMKVIKQIATINSSIDINSHYPIPIIISGISAIVPPPKTRHYWFITRKWVLALALILRQ